MWIVTRGAQAGGGLESTPLAATQATLWGLGKVIAIEHPELHCVRLDLGPGVDPQTDALAAEVLSGDGEDQVALRASGRRVARLIRSAPTPVPNDDVVFRADGTYLVTGGLTGIGLEVAGFLVGRGARHLVLMGRRPASPAARKRIEEWTTAGAEVVVAQGDVSREDDVVRVLRGTGGELPPLRGIFHSAGIVADGVLVQQDWERFAKVFAPKVEGAWNLHRATREQPLDFFVLFSSGASLLGSPGQGNYAAANAFQDALAHHRQGLGLPALSINWGAWAEVGLAADRDLGSRLSQRGMDAILPRDGLAALARVMSVATPQIGVLALDWERLASHLPAGLPFYSELARTGPSEKAGRSRAPVDLRARLQDAPPSKRQSLLHDYVVAEAARVLGVDLGKALDTDQPLQELGLDSLMAVELRNALGKLVGVTLPATLLFDFPTIEKLTDHLGREALGLDLGPHLPSPIPKASRRAEAEASLEALSDQEMAALLAEKLDLIDAKGEGSR
jgi:NAD(P)-dependent dehydrogenase (short-subunit alcohol dehydrogenase family)/acyl carrier protein